MRDAGYHLTAPPITPTFLISSTALDLENGRAA